MEKKAASGFVRMRVGFWRLGGWVPSGSWKGTAFVVRSPSGVAFEAHRLEPVVDGLLNRLEEVIDCAALNVWIDCAAVNVWIFCCFPIPCRHAQPRHLEVWDVDELAL